MSLLKYWEVKDSFSKEEKSVESNQIKSEQREHFCILCDKSNFETSLIPILREDGKIFYLCKECEEKVLKKTGNIIPENLPEMLNAAAEEVRIDLKTMKKKRLKIRRRKKLATA